MKEALLKLKLDGVMYHVALFEKHAALGLCGYAAMHKHHAEEEFNTYLELAKQYICESGKIPELVGISAPQINIDGATVKEKIENGLDVYEIWEKSVLAKLKRLAAENEDTDIIEKLIKDVRCELKCIRCMHNDLDEDKYDELNNWLNKKYGE